MSAPTETDPSRPSLTPLRRGASHGWLWIRHGWEMVLSRPLPWISTSVFWLFISVLANMYPLVAVLYPLAYPVMLGGIMLGCRQQERLGVFPPLALFSAIDGYARKLMKLGLFSLLANLFIAMVLAVFLALFGGEDLVAALNTGEVENLLPFTTALLLVALLAMLLYLPFAMALWFAPALMVIHDYSAPMALRMSIKACAGNILPFLTYGAIFLLVIFLLTALATLAPLLPAIALLPILSVFFASIYTSFGDIYSGGDGTVEVRA